MVLIMGEGGFILSLMAIVGVVVLLGRYALAEGRKVEARKKRKK